MGGGGAPSIPQRNLGQELGSILSYAPKFAQKEFQLTQQNAPKFSQQDIGLLQQYAPQYAGLGLNIAQQYAPGYLALNQQQMQQAISGSPLLSELNTQGLSQLKAGPSPILSTLQSQALGQLQAGGKLTPEQERDVAQATRAGFAARGNVLGNQALGAELLNRDIYARQRLMEAQQLGMGVEGLSEQATAQRFGLAGDVQRLNLGTLAGMGGVVQMPNLAAYAAPGAGYAPFTAGQGAAAGVVNPLLGYGQDLFSSNQNAAATQAIAGANKSAGTTSGILGTVGSIAGAVGTAY